MNDTIIGLLGYITWILVLLAWIAVYRTLLVVKKQYAVNEFQAGGANSPAFGERLARAQGNCVESFAFIGGLMLLALATNSTEVTDALAVLMLAARLAQSITHLLSTSMLAVQVRFVFFLIQLFICFYWVVQLALKFIGDH